MGENLGGYYFTAGFSRQLGIKMVEAGESGVEERPEKAPHPRVLSIFISPEKGQPMQEVETAQAVAGKGLEGDRYFYGIGAWSNVRVGETVRHVSLIAMEAIEEANAQADSSFTPAETRRNILTIGIDLNNLVGQEFVVGGVHMRGVELCEPCARPSALSGKRGFKDAFELRGGLRAEILSNGTITAGDGIVVLNGE